MVSLLWKSLTPILFILGMVLARLSVFVLLKSDLCTHDCAQKLVEREAAENIQSFFCLIGNEITIAMQLLT